MARNNKFFFHGGVHFVSTSIEEGILLPPNALVKELVFKSIAQAQEKYNVDISAIMVMGNHVHMIVKIIDPTDFVNFMGMFKRESAHAINRVLGIKKRTVWCEGYDSPLLPNIDTVKQKIAYIYANPADSDLVDNVEEYPGFNSFRMTKYLAGLETDISEHVDGDCFTIKTYRIARHHIKALPKGVNFKPQDYKRERNAMVKGKEEITFKIDPNAWMEWFGITSEEEKKQINQDIIERVYELEKECRERRMEKKKGVMGRKRLERTPIGAPKVSNRKGRRMLVHCTCPETRKMWIRFIKAKIAEAKRIWKQWVIGDFSEPWPMGLFPPTELGK